MMRCWLTLALVLWASLAQATTYFLSPSGSNSNNGLSSGAPWLTFAHALANGWGCGDTLTLLNGVYGDGTSTGKVSISNVNCSLGNEMVLRALNERQARIHDNGTGRAILIGTSSYLILDGIVFNSSNNNSITVANGIPMQIHTSHHIIVRKCIGYNPNKYFNLAVVSLASSPSTIVRDSLFEDNEWLDYHRHGITTKPGERITVRRNYCNPRTGVIAGGYQGYAVGGADSCISFYPCKDCIIENTISDHRIWLTENNGSGEIALSGNKILGSIAYQPHGNSIYMNARFTGTQNSPTNMLIENYVAYQPKVTPSGLHGNPLRISDPRNVTVRNVTVIGSTQISQGIVFDTGPNGGPANEDSITLRNMVITGLPNGSTGFVKSSSFTGTWGGDYLTANTNGTGGTSNFSPALTSNWGANSNTSSPGLGTCIAWVPDSATNLKGTGENGADRGANILYRYVDGVLTTIPLWDPTTGEFPHGALVTGLNDVAGDSLFDIHVRLNINRNGCSFPSGYAGGGGGEPEEPPPDPEDPTDHASGTGTTSTSYAHVLPANTDAVSVQIALWDIESNVGSVSAVTVCGNAASLISGAAVTTSPAYRRAEIWGYAPGTANTLSGSCTIAVSTTGNVDGVVTTSSAHADASAFNTGVGATALSGAPTVTITTNTNETIIDSLAASKTVTLSSGPDQTLRLDTSHSTQSLRGAASTQAASAGGVMSYTLGGNNYWALAAATVSPQGGSTPPSPIPELAQTKFRFHGLYGTESAPIVKAATDTNISIVPVGKIRLRIELTAAEANYPATGLVLFCSQNGGAYVQAQDTFGSNAFRLLGVGAEPDVPSSLTATTQQIGSGDFVTGAVIRSTSAAFAPAIPNGDHTELEWALELNATAGDTVACRVYQDNGTAIDTYTVTPTLTVIPMMAGGGL